MMNNLKTDNVFAGSIPQIYDTHLVPLIFESYAQDLAARVKSGKFSRLLEVAAGTGVVTRALASTLPADVDIVATDLNQAMLDCALAIGTKRPVQWQQADAMQLPFPDAEFDIVVCQFGVMFFPDKSKAFAEVRRVLRPGGTFLFNVWDRLTENEFADTITSALETVFPQDPPRFLARTPYGYHDRHIIAQDLAAGGFHNAPKIDTVAERSRASSPDIPAIAYCQGSPLKTEIETRNASLLGKATDAAAKFIADRFGNGPVDGKIQAHIIAVTC